MIGGVHVCEVVAFEDAWQVGLTDVKVGGGRSTRKVTLK